MTVYRSNTIQVNLGSPSEIQDLIDNLTDAINQANASKIAAQTSAGNAETYYMQFKGAFYGSLAADPSTDPNGDAITAGDLYWNTVASALKVYDGSVWQAIVLASTAAAYPFPDNKDLFTNATDNTKKLKYDLSGISAATTRTITWQDKDGTVALVSDLYSGTPVEFSGTVPADNTIARYDGVTGNKIQSTGITIDDSDNVTLAGELKCVDNTVSRANIKDYGETVSTPSSASGALTIDLSAGNVAEVTLTENTTITFSNPPTTGVAGSLTLILKQDATGSRTVTWPASVDWPDATAPAISTAASAVDVLTFVTTDAGTTWYGFMAGGGMA